MFDKYVSTLLDSLQQVKTIHPTVYIQKVLEATTARRSFSFFSPRLPSFPCLSYLLLPFLKPTIIPFSPASTNIYFLLGQLVTSYQSTFYITINKGVSNIHKRDVHIILFSHLSHQHQHHRRRRRRCNRSTCQTSPCQRDHHSYPQDGVLQVCRHAVEVILINHQPIEFHPRLPPLQYLRVSQKQPALHKHHAQSLTKIHQ